MQLTKHTDISLRVLMDLATFPNRLGTVKDISVRYNISRNHLVKVVHGLSGLGYIESVQGRGGGIKLAKPAGKIIVGRVVRHMEATLDVVDCEKNNCPLSTACILKKALNQATKAFLATLDKYTVADLVKNKTAIIRMVGP